MSEASAFMEIGKRLEQHEYRLQIMQTQINDLLQLIHEEKNEESPAR